MMLLRVNYIDRFEIVICLVSIQDKITISIRLDVVKCSPAYVYLANLPQMGLWGGGWKYALSRYWGGNNQDEPGTFTVQVHDHCMFMRTIFFSDFKYSWLSLSLGS